MEAILSLPMVLLHRDFGTCNIMVDGTSCRLTGIIDWAEAEICPLARTFIPWRLLRVHFTLKMGGGDTTVTRLCRTPFGAHFRTKWETYLQRPSTPSGQQGLWAYCGLVASRNGLQICRRPLPSVTMRRDVTTCYL